MLAGHNRLRAAQELGLSTVPVFVMRGLSDADQLVHLVQDNVARRHLTQSQRAAMVTHPKVSAALISAFESDARARQAEGGRNKGKLEATLPQARALQTRDMLATRAGVSARLITEAKRGWQQAPDKMEAVIADVTKQTVSSIARGLASKGAARKERGGLTGSGKLGPVSEKFVGAYKELQVHVVRLLADTLLQAHGGQMDEPARQRFLRGRPEMHELFKAFDVFGAQVAQETSQIQASAGAPSSARRESAILRVVPKHERERVGGVNRSDPPNMQGDGRT